MESLLETTYGNRINRVLTSASDYHKERHRINKRLAKLRLSLSLKNKNTKNYKRRQFNAEDYQKEPRVADILLLTIERDVLYALETKIVIEVQSSKSKERFISSKYKKAISHSQQLLSIITSLDDSTKLQSYIYSAIIQGSYSFFKRRWDLAMYLYSVARIGLQCLLDSDYPQKQILNEIIDNVVDPSFKLCLYNSSNSSSSPNLNAISKKLIETDQVPYLKPLISLIDERYLQLEDEVMDSIKEVTWSKYTAAIHDDDTSRLLLTLENYSKLEHKNPSSFDPLLLSWQILLDHHTKEMEKVNDSLNDEEIQDNQILLTYINYHYNFIKIERDLTLLEEIDTKQSNKVSIKKSLKILDNILLTFSQIKELPGVYNDEKIWKSLETYELYYNIIKINQFAQSYLISGQYKESLLLLGNASSLLAKIDTTIDIDQTTHTRLPNSQDLQKLSQTLNTLTLKSHTLTEYYNSKPVNDQYYIENLKNVPNDMNKLVNVKDYQMVHQKPVLFDIAFNYVSYTKLDDKDDKKKGFFGLFGGNR